MTNHQEQKKKPPGERESVCVESDTETPIRDKKKFHPIPFPVDCVHDFNREVPECIVPSSIPFCRIYTCIRYYFRCTEITIQCSTILTPLFVFIFYCVTQTYCKSREKTPQV